MLRRCIYSPILNNDPNVANAEDTLLFNLFNYPHLNKDGEPIFKNIIVIGSITKHTFFNMIGQNFLTTLIL